MEPELQTFKEFLKKRGMRQTREREAIIREVLSLNDHFDVDSLFIRMKKKFSVSKASIYRTLPLMIEAGLITEVYLEDGHMHYEQVYGREHHCHLRCSNCRSIVEFSDPRLIEIEKEVTAYYGYTTKGHKLEIIGLCPKCCGKK